MESNSNPNFSRWSAAEDRPYIRDLQRERSAAPRAILLWLAFFIVVAGVGGGAFYYFVSKTDPLGPAPFSADKPPPQAAAPAETVSAAPPPEEPAPAQAAAALPSLDNSDSLMRDTVTGLVGRPAFEAMVYPKELVRRIVATVDNLPRETAPRRVMPLEPVPGVLGVASAGEEVTLAGANAGRYLPYVRVFEALDARALVRRYAEAYPLFQRAYAELGFPDRRFHDRLLEAIDDLLEAPTPAGPVKLVRPKVIYQFADPELESLSAGQKMMIRIGPDNAARVKAKLRELRRELIAVKPR